MTSRTKKNIIALAADHNGVELKRKIKPMLSNEGFHCIDLGPYNVDISVDYAVYAKQLGHIVSAGDADWGILICGTGIGMSMAVNKVDNIRAALVHNLLSAKKSREHNDANVLCLGAWVNPDKENLEIVKTWLSECFGEYRHVRRVEQMTVRREETIVVANGIFDILHTGHIELLKFSKSLGTKLVVAINSDRATTLLKGPSRPINTEQDRKAVLEAISYVDEVVIFDDTKPTELIKTLMPNIVVKGGEWTADEVRIRDSIPEGVLVKIYPLVKEYSSTNVLTTAEKKKECLPC